MPQLRLLLAVEAAEKKTNQGRLDLAGAKGFEPHQPKGCQDKCLGSASTTVGQIRKHTVCSRDCGRCRCFSALGLGSVLVTARDGGKEPGRGGDYLYERRCFFPLWICTSLARGRSLSVSRTLQRPVTMFTNSTVPVANQPVQPSGLLHSAGARVFIVASLSFQPIEPPYSGIGAYWVLRRVIR
jgi:hypothetical protein